MDRQTATAEILRVISQSQTDVQPVFEAIADSAMRLFGAWGSLVFRYDGELISLAAARGGLPGSSDTMMARFESHPATDSTVAGRTILSRAVQHIVDIETDPAWGRLAGGNARLRGWRSSVQVPMLSGDDVLGIIAVSRAEPGGFSPAEITLLQTFADQAVIAVKNARLLTEIQESNRDLTESLDRQTATADILRAISQAQTDVQPVFEAIADSAMRLFGAGGAAVARYDGELISMVAARGGLPGSAATVKERLQSPHPPTSPPEHAVLTKRVHHVVDVETDPSCGSEFRRHAAERGFRSFASVPMLRGNDPLGIIVVNRAEPTGFSSDEIALLQTFADQAVIAVENARLLTELEARNRDLTESLDRQTATADILRAISQAQTDVQPVFEAIVRSAARLCGAQHGGVYRFDGSLVHSVAHEGYTPEQLEQWRRTFPRPVTAPGAACAAIRTGRVCLYRERRKSIFRSVLTIWRTSGRGARGACCRSRCFGRTR